MPSLSLVRTDFGKVIKWSGIIIIILIMLFIVFKMLFYVKELISPTPPPGPTVIFGQLPKPDLPQSIEKDFTFEIDTLNGDLPIFPIETNVYGMEQRGPDILAVENASSNISTFGFNRRPQQISDFIYKWTNPNIPNQIIVMNIKLDEFNLTSSYLNHGDKLRAGRFEGKNSVVSKSNSFLVKLGMYQDDIKNDKTIVEFSKLNDGVIQNVDKEKDANIATVYYFQSDRNEVPIVYPQGSKSSMKLVLGSGNFENIVLDASFSHQNILEETGTYPIISAQEALEKLKNKNGSVISHNGDNTNIKIKEVYLALYSEGKLQDYLTPIIVFEGDNNFLAYVPAVTNEWYDN